MDNEYQNQNQASQPETNGWLEDWPSKLACILASLSTACGIFTVLGSDICFRLGGILIIFFSMFIFLVEITLFVSACASIQTLLVGLLGRCMARQAYWARAVFYLVLTILPYAICAPIFGIKLDPPYGITLILGGVVNLAICVALLAAQLLGVPLNNQQMISNSAC